MHIGGGHDFDFGRVKLTIAHHGNTVETPDAMAPAVSTSAVCRDGKVDTTVKKLSWNVFRFKKLV